MPDRGDLTLVQTEGLAAGYGAAPVLTDVVVRAARAASAWASWGPTAAARRRSSACCSASSRRMAGTLRAPARFAVVPQTERSRLDFPVSALDVALMGSISTLPWWRRPGRAQRRAARAALAAVGLAEQADATFGDLSGGQRQRVLVARALVQDARVILLDEPFTGLDAPSAERLEALLARARRRGARRDDRHPRRRPGARVGQRAVPQPPPGRLRPAGATLDRAVLEATYGGEIVELPRRRAARRAAAPPPPLMLAVAAHAHRSVGRPGRAPRAARGRAAGRDAAARWGAGSSSTTSPTAPSRWPTRCCRGSSSPRSRASRCCSAARRACSWPRSRSPPPARCRPSAATPPSPSW